MKQQKSCPNCGLFTALTGVSPRQAVEKQPMCRSCSGETKINKCYDCGWFTAGPSGFCGGCLTKNHPGDRFAKTLKTEYAKSMAPPKSKKGNHPARPIPFGSLTK